MVSPVFWLAFIFPETHKQSRGTRHFRIAVCYCLICRKLFFHTALLLPSPMAKSLSHLKNVRFRHCALSPHQFSLHISCPIAFTTTDFCFSLLLVSLIHLLLFVLHLHLCLLLNSRVSIPFISLLAFYRIKFCLQFIPLYELGHYLNHPLAKIT